jgi:hypothetical protein
MNFGSQAWWYTPVIPTLRQEDHELEEASLGNIEIPCLKNFFVCYLFVIHNLKAFSHFSFDLLFEPLALAI